MRSPGATASRGSLAPASCARGLIYAIIGILAIKLAFGAGGKTTDQQGAMQTVAHQPFGTVLLVLLAIGLGGYALWRFRTPRSATAPSGATATADRVRGALQRHRLRRLLRARNRDSARLP